MAELPEPIEFTGDWDAYVDELYAIYTADLVDRRCKLFDLDVTVKKRPEIRGKHESFWHAIQGGEPDATPSIDRAKYIPWIRVLVESVGDDDVHCWRSPRPRYRRRPRILIAASDFQYVVVLDLRIGRRSPYWIIVSAYTPLGRGPQKLSIEYGREGEYRHIPPS